MELEQVTFVGPPIDDPEILERLPSSLSGLLRQINGFIQFDGGLHIRGACNAPAWHSLRNAWDGDESFHSLYRDLRIVHLPEAGHLMHLEEPELLAQHIVEFAAAR